MAIQHHKDPSPREVEQTRSTAVEHGDASIRQDSAVVFARRALTQDTSLLTDDILPAGVLLEFVPVDTLNSYINFVELRSVIAERDPEEDERYINQSNRFYTHFHEFGTVVHVIGSSRDFWWYFCYDIDSNDCALGRERKDLFELPDIVKWVYQKRVTRRYPVGEIDVRRLEGWRSFR